MDAFERQPARHFYQHMCLSAQRMLEKKTGTIANSGFEIDASESQQIFQK